MGIPKRRIQTGGADRFVISEQNPNDTAGGWCACGPHPEDQKGPFIVFHGAVAAGNKAVRPVVCAPCAKSAVISVERGDETAVLGAASPEDVKFNGGPSYMPPDLAQRKLEYERYAASVGLLEAPTFEQWLAGVGDEIPKDIRGGLDTTGIDPNATSLLQARADTTPVVMRGGAVHGRTDDPVEQISNPANWGTPDDGRE